MIVAALTVAIAVAVLVGAFVPEKYSSSVEFYVVNTNTNYDYTTSALLSASEYLINDYIKLIKSDTILKAVADEANKDLSENLKVKPKEIKSMISSSSEENTSLFTIKITHTEPKVAKAVAEAIKDITPALVTEIAKPKRLTNEYLVDVAWSTIVELERAALKAENPDTATITNADVTKSLKEKYGNDIETVIEDYLKTAGMDGSLYCFEAVNYPVEDSTADSPDIPKYAIVGAIFSAAVVYSYSSQRDLSV